MCRDLDIILYECIYELMTWLLEVYAIFPLWCFIVGIFMHVDCELFEDVTSISWIFIIFAWFIALIEVERYKLDRFHIFSVLFRLFLFFHRLCMTLFWYLVFMIYMVAGRCHIWVHSNVLLPPFPWSTLYFMSCPTLPFNFNSVLVLI